MEHTFVASAHSLSVDFVKGQLGDVAQLDEVWVAQNVILLLECILGSGVECCSDGIGVCECGRSPELSSCLRVLIELGHRNV